MECVNVFCILPPDSVGFSGQYRYYNDNETGLVLLGHRYYDPRTGRFINRDPIGYNGGINLYAYAGGNPIMGSDISGFIIDPGPNPKDEKMWKTVKAYLMKCPTMKTVISKLEDKSCYYSLDIGPCTGACFRSSEKVIEWDPNMGSIITDIKGKIGVMSPAIILAHELIHTYHDTIEGLLCIFVRIILMFHKVLMMRKNK